MPTPFLEALQRAQASGEWVSLVDYAQELKPSKPKRRKILSIDADAKRMQVQREDGSEVSYRINVVLYVEDAAGRCVNYPAAQKLKKYIEGREERVVQRHLTNEALRDLNTPVGKSCRRIVIVQELDGTFQGEPQTFFALHNFERKRTAVIACAKSHVQRLVDILNDDQGFWEFADLWITARFMWPIWIRQKEESMPEVDWLDFPALFAWANTTPGELVRLYITKGWLNHQFFAPDKMHISRADARCLQAHALCIPGEKLPISELMRHVKFVELKKPLQARGIRPGRSREHVIEQYGDHMSEAVELELRKSPSMIGTYLLSPPPGFTWEGWHGFRKGYACMHQELTLWLYGYTDDNKKYSALV